jgi:hypothetical protein
MRGARRPWPIAPLAALLVVVAVAACAPAATTTFPPLGSTPGPAGDATAATRDQVIAALAAAGVQAVEANRPFRPPEGALLAAARRTVLQVTLPDDPDGAWIVIYALGSPNDAEIAAKDHAAYIATGPGRVQFALDTRFVIQVVGSTVVFFSWSPANSPDARTGAVAQALATLGTQVPVPN